MLQENVKPAIFTQTQEELHLFIASQKVKRRGKKNTFGNIEPVQDVNLFNYYFINIVYTSLKLIILLLISISSNAVDLVDLNVKRYHFSIHYKQ